MVVPTRRPSPQPLYLLQEAGDPNLHPVLRRVRDRRSAVPWRLNHLLELRANVCQRMGAALSRDQTALLLSHASDRNTVTLL